MCRSDNTLVMLNDDGKYVREASEDEAIPAASSGFYFKYVRDTTLPLLHRGAARVLRTGKVEILEASGEIQP